jgi:hypothetical protein
MQKLQVFIAVGNRSYKNRLSLDGVAARQCFCSGQACLTSRYKIHDSRYRIKNGMLFAFNCPQLPFSFSVSRSTLHVSRYSLLRPYLLESSYKFSFTRFINSDIREFGNYRITSERLLFQPLRNLQPPIGQNRPRFLIFPLWDLMKSPK